MGAAVSNGGRTRVRRKAGGNNRGLAALMGLTFAAMVVLFGFLAWLERSGYFDPEVSVAVDLEEKVVSHRIVLGMDIDAVRRLYPGLRLKVEGMRTVVGTFVLDGATHTVWFFHDGERERAYRIRYTKTFHALGEDDVLGHFVKGYGRPAYDACRREKGGESRLCHYRWIGGEATAVDVHARSGIEADAGLRATIVATDTYMDQRRRRLEAGDRFPSESLAAVPSLPGAAHDDDAAAPARSEDPVPPLPPKPNWGRTDGTMPSLWQK